MKVNFVWKLIAEWYLTPEDKEEYELMGKFKEEIKAGMVKSLQEQYGGEQYW